MAEEEPKQDEELEEGEIEDDDEDEVAHPVLETRHNDSNDALETKEQDVETDEEKRRRLEAKIHALERQMAVEGSRYSPNDEDLGEEESSDTNYAKSERRSKKERRKQRKLDDDVKEEPKRKRQRDDERRSHRRDNVIAERNQEICKAFMQGKCPKVSKG